MAPIKTYDVVITNLKRTKAELRDNTSDTPIYELDLSFALRDLKPNPSQHSIIMRSLGHNTTKLPSAILGTCDLSFTSLTTPIHLGFGDPTSPPEDMIWEDIHCREKWMQNGFELSIDLGSNLGRKVFDWKRTHNVDSIGALSRTLDVLNLKMVERESGVVVARFVHNIFFGKKRGTFEFEQFEGGGDWDRVVVLSGMAVLEYMRKSQGWSW